MKLAYKYRFCIWLVDTLVREPKTFAEIRAEWAESSVNADAAPITERTFNRYRQDAEIMMDVNIDCDKRNGYRYSVETYHADRQTQAAEWMLNAFRISNLAAGMRQKNAIALESPPPAAHWLQTVSEAIGGGFALKLSYKSHYCPEPKNMELIPAFVRLYKQRWYVVGKIKDEERAQTLAFERIGTMEIVRRKTPLPPKWAKELTPSRYFEHCFGIIRQHEPITITFRAFFPQDAYIKDVPLHASQKIVHACSDYTDFSIHVRPAYDLKQELLWHRDKIAVLSPQSFRRDMTAILKAALANYETGQNHAIDE